MPSDNLPPGVTQKMIDDLLMPDDCANCGADLNEEAKLEIQDLGDDARCPTCGHSPLIAEPPDWMVERDEPDGDLG